MYRSRKKDFFKHHNIYYSDYSIYYLLPIGQDEFIGHVDRIINELLKTVYNYLLL